MEKAKVAVDAVAFKILMLVVPQKICHRPTSTDIDRHRPIWMQWFVMVCRSPHTQTPYRLHKIGFKSASVYIFLVHRSCIMFIL